MQTLKDIYALPYKYDVKQLPARGGVYFLIKNERHILYIGQSESIRDRVGQHTAIMKDYKPRIYYYLVEDEKERLAFETFCISRFLPILNIKIEENIQVRRIVLTYAGIQTAMANETETAILGALRTEFGFEPQVIEINCFGKPQRNVTK